MRRILMIISYVGLGLTAIPGFLVFNGVITFSSYTNLMIAGALLWFLTAPFWIDKGQSKNEHS